MTAEEFKTMCNKNKGMALTVGDLKDPDNVWHVRTIGIYNKKGVYAPMLGDIDEYPEETIAAIVSQSQVMLKTILKEDSYQKLVDNGAFRA